MAETGIGWTDEQWNPYGWNCTKVSPGCAHCYAEALSKRWPGNSTGGLFAGRPFWNKNAMKRLRAVKPGSTVFVNTMSDTYHEGAPLRYIHAIHNAAAYLRPDLIFLLLTKRPERALALAPYLAWPKNLWLGTSVENADYLPRLHYLLSTPAAGHFLSAEPLLGPLGHLEVWAGWTKLNESPNRLKWVIVGGESGPDNTRRPFMKRWAAEIRTQCDIHKVPFFFKQGSARLPGKDRLLWGRTWDERPAEFGAIYHD